MTLHPSSVPHGLYSDARRPDIFSPSMTDMIGVSTHVTWPFLLKTKCICVLLADCFLSNDIS